MPVIGRFYNILIKMHYIEDEHNPPHVHVYVNEYEGVFDIRTEELIKGSLPTKAFNIVKRFISSNKARLIEMWEKQDFELLDYKE